MADSQAIANRLESLHLEGLPLDVEEKERERLQRLGGGRVERGSIEKDIVRYERRKRSLEHIWLWHRRQLLFASEGAVTAFDATRSGKKGSKIPPKVDARFRALNLEWQFARTNDKRRQIVNAIQELHRDVLLQKPKELIRGTEDWRRAIAVDPRPSRVVGRQYGVSHTEVLRCRVEFAGEARAA